MKTKVTRKPTKPKLKPRPAESGLKARLVRIGNSRGVRLPKAVIEQAGLTEQVELSVVDGQVIIRSATEKHPRAGWDEAFAKALAELGPGALEREREEWADWQNMSNKFDEEEWTW